MMPQLIWRIDGDDPIIYLTFDDGPIPEVTPWVVDQLSLFNAKATFFCVGDNVFKHPDIYNLLLENGHSVGNHTYNHISGWSNLRGDYISNINKASDYIDSNLFRPPYGRITPLKFRSIRDQYQVIMWDVLSGDFDGRIDPEICLQNVIKNTKAGSIIVFHDSLKAKKNLEYCLPRVLEHFTLQGYEFAALKSQKVSALNKALI